MLKDEAIDVVVATPPPPLHFTLCKQTLEAGKHGMFVFKRFRKLRTVLLTFYFNCSRLREAFHDKQPRDGGARREWSRSSTVSVLKNFNTSLIGDP